MVTSNTILDAPKADEVEISLFGPSYGESLAVHIGRGEWFIVDSCVVPKTGEPRSLHYLESIKVDSTSLKLIVATHWDDDHVRGLGKLLESATNAEFVISGAIYTKEFLTLLRIYKNETLRNESGVKELARVLEILVARNQQPVMATQNKILLNSTRHGFVQMLKAFSPSDKTVLNGIFNISTLLSQVLKSRIKVTHTIPNNRSIVLGLTVGNISVLLGSDLEEASDIHTGWSPILDSNQPPAISSVYKVAHHGSKTGHINRIWSDLLIANPFAILAPWKIGGRSIPTRQGLLNISAKTDKVFVTTIPQSKKKKRPPEVQRMINASVRSLSLVNQSLGHIRLRANLNDNPPIWNIALFNGARKIEGTLAKAFASEIIRNRKRK